MLSKVFWYILGHEPLLSLAELSAVSNKTPILLSKDIARTESNLDQKALIQKLGGTVKIAEEIAYGLNEDQLLEAMAAELKKTNGKIHFGLSLYAVPNGAKQGEKWGLSLKKQLKLEGRSVRYVDNRGKPILSSVSVEKNGLTDRGSEFIILPEKSQYKLAKTVAVQPFESFSERDFGRPGRDDLSGMLPPKLAMMMINLAQIPFEKAIYDPFCGSGTILSEAALIGFSELVGSDISTKAISDTQKNIDWMSEKSGHKVRAILFEHDIQKKPMKIELPIGGIVTEPFLGPPLKGHETIEALKNNAEELAALYINSFQSFASVLPKDSKVIFIFPRFTDKIRTSELAVPAIIKLGFKVAPILTSSAWKEPYILYQRANQHLGREIWKFTI